MPREILFGALAVLMCLLTMGANIHLKVIASVEEILKISEPGKCHYEPLSAPELMQVVSDIIKGWSTQCKTRWTCLFWVLLQTEEYQNQIAQSRNDRSDRSLSSGLMEEPLAGSEPAAPSSSDDEACTLDGTHAAWPEFPCGDPERGLL